MQPQILLAAALADRIQKRLLPFFRKGFWHQLIQSVKEQICKRRIQCTELPIRHTAFHIFNTVKEIHARVERIIEEVLVYKITMTYQNSKKQGR